MPRPQRKRPKNPHAELERKKFLLYCAQNGLPTPTPEFKFAAPDRLWRFDWCWPELGVALEVEGGVWIQGRHSRGTGMLEDMLKYNSAALRGYSVYRVTPDQLYQPETLDLLRAALAGAPRRKEA